MYAAYAAIETRLLKHGGVVLRDLLRRRLVTWWNQMQLTAQIPHIYGIAEENINPVTLVLEPSYGLGFVMLMPLMLVAFLHR